MKRDVGVAGFENTIVNLVFVAPPFFVTDTEVMPLSACKRDCIDAVSPDAALFHPIQLVVSLSLAVA